MKIRLGFLTNEGREKFLFDNRERGIFELHEQHGTFWLDTEMSVIGFIFHRDCQVFGVYPN